ncbi:class I SAM-dependent methyltransferase [Luteipulveratus flavus]|uniref:Class I SAM-dependent methyltransferase n=1 Tax=Luteipulveratus flavus TaxID=3031728 RepID=A0ABT6C1G4_9MICO|nr:class I SAM-dependent methyltransferase [Luteipulveratus sp. YIM 133296]MDF8262684.1 class I SAM-dependent methyltransferase [Luteipulveratus sp. YIM 133296]
MIAGALEPYEGALRDRTTLDLTTDDGRVVPLDIDRYLAEPDVADGSVLDRCTGPVLDVGCGPGRMVRALAERGIPALGVDIAQVAVELAVRRGALALPRDVFARLPGEGRWRTVLVLDGNSGIGGDLGGLLGRLRQVVGPRGLLVVESGSRTPGTHEVLTARFAGGGPAFRWGVASADVIAGVAEQSGLVAQERWACNERDFVALRRAG